MKAVLFVTSQTIV